MPTTTSIKTQEGRFARLEAIEWWNQDLLARSQVLVIGAGALGNEVIKNLAMLGVGHVVVVDMDSVETSNLSRSVLFREGNEGQPKAVCAAAAARNIYSGIEITPVVGNVLANVGLGYFRWADVIIGALDNREARVFVNAACARVRRPWFDGGIEVLQGVVRGFSPPATACYECTMSRVDWDLLNKRRSCSLLARRAAVERGTPTTPTTASVIGAMQVAEAIKHLHGLPSLLGKGFVFEGAEHTSYSVTYPTNPECPWHEEAPVVESHSEFSSDTPLSVVWEAAAERLGGLDSIEFARELVEKVECSACGYVAAILQPAEMIEAERLKCPSCGMECAPLFLHSISTGSELLASTPREIGLPAWDIVWARRGETYAGFELTGDNPWRGGQDESNSRRGEHALEKQLS
ncbi:MAG: molybdopterin biosynthesis protein MoeB [Verrucomicrobia bacterium]|nr:MAG: molybdopterin biosynthesis protein MoeB [Verrucomicrobiota bacterium]